MFYSMSNANPSSFPGPDTGLRSDVDQMKSDVERLLMITEALWQILKEKHGYEDAELLKRVMTIDMRDGRLDGKVAAQAPQKCPHCGRTLFKARPRCLYCGEYVAVDPFLR
jgi:hypothetical protein